MRSALRAVLVVAMVAATVTAVVGVTAMPGGIVVDSKQVTVKVVGVNQTARTLTLEMPSGNTVTYRVGKNIRNFSQIKKGDTIKATLLDSLAVYIQKHGGKPTATETTTVVLSPRGAMPGAIVANTIRITGKIQLVDAQNRTITVTGPSYMSKAFKVGHNVNLSGLKAGDDVVVRYTEALAINVQKPKK